MFSKGPILLWELANDDPYMLTNTPLSAQINYKMLNYSKKKIYTYTHINIGAKGFEINSP